MPSRRAVPVLLLTIVLIASAACSDDPGTSGATTTTSAAAETTAPDDPDGAAFVDTLTFLAEEGDGRDNVSEGSRAVQNRLVDELDAIAQPVPGGQG